MKHPKPLSKPLISKPQTTPLDARGDGYDAAIDGLRPSDNPHTDPTLRAAWDAGWTDGMRAEYLLAACA